LSSSARFSISDSLTPKCAERLRRTLAKHVMIQLEQVVMTHVWPRSLATKAIPASSQQFVPAPLALSRRIKITYRSAAAMSLCRNSSTSPMRILHWQTAALLFT
jgi:hypothetical protein